MLEKFKTFSGLSWKQDNWQQIILRFVERRITRPPDKTCFGENWIKMAAEHVL